MRKYLKMFGCINARVLVYESDVLQNNIVHGIKNASREDFYYYKGRSSILYVLFKATSMAYIFSIIMMSEVFQMIE